MNFKPKDIKKANEAKSRVISICHAGLKMEKCICRENTLCLLLGGDSEEGGAQAGDRASAKKRLK